MYARLLSVITPHLFALLGLEFAVGFPKAEPTSSGCGLSAQEPFSLGGLVISVHHTDPRLCQLSDLGLVSALGQLEDDASLLRSAPQVREKRPKVRVSPEAVVEASSRSRAGRSLPREHRAGRAATQGTRRASQSQPGSPRAESVLLSVTAETNYCRLGGLKQHTFILLEFLEARNPEPASAASSKVSAEAGWGAAALPCPVAGTTVPGAGAGAGPSSAFQANSGASSSLCLLPSWCCLLPPISLHTPSRKEICDLNKLG